MGHLRLGRLPKTYKWRAVIDLLNETPDDPAALAGAVVKAAEARLRELGRDSSLTYCFWLLTRITWAARREDFTAALSELDLPPAGDGSALVFISGVSDRVRSELIHHPESGPFAELASLALRRALSETVGQEGRSLFGSSMEDIQHAFREYSTARRFGILARRFFGDFFSRTLSFYVEKELANNIGEGHGLSSIADSEEFTRALDIYTRQSAFIMEEFASGWYSKQNWESKGHISLEDAQGFVAVALRKLRMELVYSAS